GHHLGHALDVAQMPRKAVDQFHHRITVGARRRRSLGNDVEDVDAERELVADEHGILVVARFRTQFGDALLRIAYHHMLADALGGKPDDHAHDEDDGGGHGLAEFG